MLKAAVSRLSRLIAAPCSRIEHADTAELFLLIHKQFAAQTRTSDEGDARRLAAKIVRLRDWKREAGAAV